MSFAREVLFQASRLSSLSLDPRTQTVPRLLCAFFARGVCPKLGLPADPARSAGSRYGVTGRSPCRNWLDLAKSLAQPFLPRCYIRAHTYIHIGVHIYIYMCVYINMYMSTLLHCRSSTKCNSGNIHLVTVQIIAPQHRPAGALAQREDRKWSSIALVQSWTSSQRLAKIRANPWQSLARIPLHPHQSSNFGL